MFKEARKGKDFDGFLFMTKRLQSKIYMRSHEEQGHLTELMMEAQLTDQSLRRNLLDLGVASPSRPCLRWIKLFSNTGALDKQSYR